MQKMWLPLCVAVAAGCPAGTDTDTDTGETPEEITERMFAELITVTDAPSADDLSCWAGGDDWLLQDPDPALQIEEVRTVQVRDFETGNRVEQATVELFYGDDPTATPDATATTDGSGDVSMTVPACQPFAYKVSTPPELEATKVTFESHQIFEPVAINDATEVNSVSTTTFALIPSLLGVTIDEDKSIIAGGVQDCTGEAVEGAQVVVRDADGNIPESLIVKYFVEDFPSRTQPYTSADGLWVAMNVPAGEWVVEAYVADGAGGHVLVGSSPLSSVADSINISNIYWGRQGGIYYPEGCLAADADADTDTGM